MRTGRYLGNDGRYYDSLIELEGANRRYAEYRKILKENERQSKLTIEQNEQLKREQKENERRYEQQQKEYEKEQMRREAVDNEILDYIEEQRDKEREQRREEDLDREILEIFNEYKMVKSNQISREEYEDHKERFARRLYDIASEYDPHSITKREYKDPRDENEKLIIKRHKRELWDDNEEVREVDPNEGNLFKDLDEEDRRPNYENYRNKYGEFKNDLEGLTDPATYEYDLIDHYGKVLFTGTIEKVEEHIKKLAKIYEEAS